MLFPCILMRAYFEVCLRPAERDERRGALYVPVEFGAQLLRPLLPQTEARFGGAARPSHARRHPTRTDPRRLTRTPTIQVSQH